MTRGFLEVMPTFKGAEELKGVLQWIKVERIIHNKKRDSITLYIAVERILPKRLINMLANDIREQFFKGRSTQVIVRENYVLPTTPTLSFLMEQYRESIEQELKEYRHSLYLMLHRAKISNSDENRLLVVAEDNMVARMNSDELKRILEKVLNERFHLNVQVQIDFEEVSEEIRIKRQEFKDQLVENEVMRIVGDYDKAHALAEEEELLKAEKKEKSKERKAKKADASREGEKAALEAAGPAEKAPQAAQRKQESAPAASKQENGFDQKKKAFFEKRKGNGERTAYSRPENVLYGRDFDDSNCLPLEEIVSEMGEVIIHGEIMKLEYKETRTGSTIAMFTIFDGTDSIGVKCFLKAETAGEFKKAVNMGLYVAIKGVSAYDQFDKEVSIASVRGIKKQNAPEKKVRMDTWPTKRVELHCHTKFSDMDAVADVGELMKTVYAWGMPALAITDHGNVQAFTEAFHKIDKGKPLKLLYGMEGYLVDDTAQVCENPDGRSLDDTFVVFDIETTGFNNAVHKIIEIGAVKVHKGEIIDRYSTFINPEEPIPYRIEELTGISDSMVADARTIDAVLPEFLAWCGDAAFVAHNAKFDVPFIYRKAKDLGLDYKMPCYLCTVLMSRFFFPHKKSRLEVIAKELGIKLESHHRAVDDAECTAGIFLEYVKRFKEDGAENLYDINRITAMTPEIVKKTPYFHVILIAKNDVGRVNLYRLVSRSHIEYFERRPRIPKTMLMENREGLIIGSACEAGELYQAIERGADDQTIASLCEFYDYLEIQPTGNNNFLLEKDGSGFSTKEDLERVNRRIYELGKIFGKPVCATCDSHFMKPEDAIYRSIIEAGQGWDMKEADNQPPLYFRTTKEMLDEFAYLGDEVAEEVVITNTNLIADMCEPIEPVRPDKCPPVIENSAEDLTQMCYDKAHEIYGPDLPEIVVERLERELHSIISNGFAVMYIIAQKLVWKSNSDGYLVGSRGSVGSSFVATMSGITEVNPLSPHYICPECHYYDFDSEEVRGYSGMAGCDMPDKNCPNCGHPLKKEGFDIPFETFLGFKGDKEPDIDLNFSGEYQSKAHDYTEVIFGKGHTFRAGTLQSLAEKTAFGYVKKYYELKEVPKRKCEMERMAKGCDGVKRGTGQHPGGIIVMPHGEEIYSFTPVQRPANDMTTKTVTTHFDYHSIDHNLLKLDILGHDDPTMIRMLEDLIGFDAKTIPLDDKKVMSLFRGTEALGITPEDIDGTRLGTLGVPEFGTDFAMQMLIDTKPKYLSDLIRIAGLAHGTDVWLGNAQDLILSGTCTIQTAICCRDDIMVYLIHMGCDKEKSFKLMEAVRKGKGLKPDEQQYLRDHGIPEWYIGSCLKIKYMFPKAHAAAYVMMAWRIAYCKIYYPLEYYTAFFSIRADGFSYEKMCLGRQVLDRNIKELKEKDANSKEKISATEAVLMKDMRLVQEFYARGFEFMKIDIMRAKADRFQIIDGKVMPSFASIDGIGLNAALQMEAAAKDGPYTSVHNFMQRAKVSKTHCDFMRKYHILPDDMPDDDQLSIFEVMGISMTT